MRARPERDEPAAYGRRRTAPPRENGGRLTLSHSGGACEKLGLPEHAEAGASGSSGSTRMAAFSGCRGNGMPGADTAAVRATLGRKGTARLACRHVHVAGHCGEAANGGRRRFYRILNRRPKNAAVPESGNRQAAWPLAVPFRRDVPVRHPGQQDEGHDGPCHRSCMPHKTEEWRCRNLSGWTQCTSYRSPTWSQYR